MKRKPRPVYINAVQRAIESSRKIHEDDVKALKEAMTESFDAFRRGEDCENHWRATADVLNIAEALSDIGICSDGGSRERIAAGHSALSVVAMRYQSRDTWALKADEMEALKEALWLHGAQLEHASLGEYEKAVKRVANRTRAALAGSIGKGVQVVNVSKGRE